MVLKESPGVLLDFTEMEFESLCCYSGKGHQLKIYIVNPDSLDVKPDCQYQQSAKHAAGTWQLQLKMTFPLEL